MKVTGKWEEEDHGGTAGWPCGVVVWGAGLLAGRFWR